MSSIPLNYHVINMNFVEHDRIFVNFLKIKFLFNQSVEKNIQPVGMKIVYHLYEIILFKVLHMYGN